MSSTDDAMSTWPSRHTFLNLTSISLLVAFFVVYVVCRTVYNLYMSPLSHIPGPKLAGPITRIAPDEVHVNDPTFIEQLFVGTARRREKGQRSINRLGASPTALGTKSHELHRRRRAALNPFFSAQKIRRLEPLIHKILDQIYERLEQSRNKQNPISLNQLYCAATHDLIADYALGQESVCFSRQDLNQPYFHAYQETVKHWHVGCYFPSLGHIARILPPSIMAALIPRARLTIENIQASMMQIDRIRSTSEASEDATIFHGLLRSDLPDSEKSSARLAEEAVVLLAAGTDSSANTMSAITYHLLTNPKQLKRLQAELKDAVPGDEMPSFASLESLPYLSAVIQEGLRLHPAVSSRQQRIAPDDDLFYTNPDTKITYKIPAGTTISMNPLLLSRLADIYPSPGEFRPERFLENPKLKQYNLTFSRGTRICLGINLAYQEMYIILAGLFKKFDAWDGTGEQKSMTLELFETTRDDIDIVRDLVTEGVKEGSLRVRVRVRGP